MGDLQHILNQLYPYGYSLCVGGFLFLLFIGYLGAPFILWVIGLLAIAIGFKISALGAVIFVGVSLLFLIPMIRRNLFSRVIMMVMQKVLPKISKTERSALEAGVVWVDGDIFSGRPNFKKILKNNVYPQLTKEEQDFLEGPVEEVCRMTNDWEVWQNRKIPENIWNYLSDNKFFGMIIPKEYGGLEFSARLMEQLLKSSQPEVFL